MPVRRPLMFHRLAKQYDLFVASKDYRAESQKLERIAQRLNRSGGRAWLDVGCGTGQHLAFLRRTHRVMGVDRSPEMLRVARRRLPKIRFVLGDMRTFRLDESFDVVSCLYGAIGHLRSERDLQLAFANIARHLRPGGVAIIEPWIDPADFRPGFVHLMSHATPEAAVVRMSISARRGARSLVRAHYLIGLPGRAIQHFQETDPGLLTRRLRLLSLMREAGLRPRLLKRGLTPGRGLLVGLKPLRPSVQGPGPLLNSGGS